MYVSAAALTHIRLGSGCSSEDTLTSLHRSVTANRESAGAKRRTSSARKVACALRGGNAERGSARYARVRRWVKQPPSEARSRSLRIGNSVGSREVVLVGALQSERPEETRE